jgi:uncharacterized protein YrrD
MIIPWEKLNNLRVETKSGQNLGLLTGFDLDNETHEIKTYRVRSKGLIKGLLKDELLISREQVISISAERMVVYDAVITQGAHAQRKIAHATPGSGAGISSRIQRNQE